MLVGALYAREAVAVLFELAAELLQPLKRLLLLGLDGLLSGELAVVVDGARKRGERGIELRLQMRRGRCRVGKLVHVFPYRRRLPQGRVEEGVLFAT